MSENGQNMESITDVREMRRILKDMRYGGYSPFAKDRSQINIIASLVRHVMDAGQHQGWSGEDVMTALAYHALLRLDEAQGRLMQDVMMRMPPQLIEMPPAALTKDRLMNVLVNACDSLHITRVHEIGGMTRTIMEDAGLLELGRAVESAHNIKEQKK